MNSLHEADMKNSEVSVENHLPNLDKISLVEDEIRTVDMMPEVRDLLRYLLVVNPRKTPSAADVLAPKEYLALAKRARVSLGRAGCDDGPSHELFSSLKGLQVRLDHYFQVASGLSCSAAQEYLLTPSEPWDWSS